MKLWKQRLLQPIFQRGIYFKNPVLVSYEYYFYCKYCEDRVWIKCYRGLGHICGVYT